METTPKDNKDLWFALLDQRNTPTKSIETSPAQRVMSGRTRTLLLTATNLLYWPQSVWKCYWKAEVKKTEIATPAAYQK